MLFNKEELKMIAEESAKKVNKELGIDEFKEGLEEVKKDLEEK